MQIREDKEQRKPTKLEILYHGITWAFVGGLYAALFVPVFEVVKGILPLWMAAICATMAASVGGALVYSSSQLALLVAMFTNFAVFGYLLYSGEMGSPLAPIIVGASLGAIVGALYALAVKESRIYRAEAILLAGLTVGVGVSVISLIWVLVVDLSLVILVMVLAPATGFIYERIVDGFIRRYSDLLPPIADGAVAGVVIGAIVGFGLWIMSGVALENAVPQWQETIATIIDATPMAIAAALFSTLLLGMLHEAFRFKFGDFSDQSKNK